MAVEELRELGEMLLRLGAEGIGVVLRVRLALEDDELRVDAGSAQLAVDAHGIAQKEVARPRCQDRRREALKVAIDRRELWVLEIVARGIELRGIAEPAVVSNEDVLDHLVGEEGVAGL